MLVLWCGAALGAVTATDSSGRRVTLAKPAERIISLAPHATELLFAAGAGSRLVAASEYSDYPQAAKRLPRVASSRAIALDPLLPPPPHPVVPSRPAATTK